jgi:hypothetical protein
MRSGPFLVCANQLFSLREQVVKYENLPNNGGVKVTLDDGRCATWRRLLLRDR